MNRFTKMTGNERIALSLSLAMMHQHVLEDRSPTLRSAGIKSEIMGTLRNLITELEELRFPQQSPQQPS